MQVDNVYVLSSSSHGFSGTGVALSIDIVLGILYSLMLLTLLFIFMTVKGPVFRYSSLIHLGEDFLSSLSQVSGGRSTKSCFATVKVGIVRNFLSKYLLYFACCFFKVLDSSSCMDAALCRIFRRITIRFLALAASSGLVHELITVVDPAVCLGNVR